MAKAKNYISSTETYVGGQLYGAGEPFISDAKPGENWKEVSPDAAAIMETAQQQVPDHAELDGLSKYALEAVAYTRMVSGIGELDKDGLINAIKMSYEPSL